MGIQPPEMTDEEAILRAAQGDEEGFGVLYQRYVGKIYNYIFYRTGNQHDAEDLTARVFYRALSHISSYTNTGVPFAAWLYRIAHNLVANWHRDNKRKNEVPLEENSGFKMNFEAPEATLVGNQERDQLLHYIRMLPPERQQLLILKVVERYSNAEVASIMRRSEGAIKSLYHRTLMQLRVTLESEKKREER